MLSGNIQVFACFYRLCSLVYGIEFVTVRLFNYSESAILSDALASLLIMRKKA